MGVRSNAAQVAGRWRLVKKVGAGSFGEIYLGGSLRGCPIASDLTSGEEVAVKIERANCKHPQLLYEARILKYLSDAPGIAKVYHAKQEGEFVLLVMQLLGSSLEDLFNLCYRRFSMKTILAIADQLVGSILLRTHRFQLKRVEYLHSRNFVHRDIKPDNFLIGIAEHADTVRPSAIPHLDIHD